MILNFFLIPENGASGAAIATVITESHKYFPSLEQRLVAILCLLFISIRGLEYISRKLSLRNLIIIVTPFLIYIGGLLFGKGMWP